MALSEPVLYGPGAGRTVSSYAALPKNVPHAFTVRGEQVRLLVTVEPAGAEYFFVPRDESDADPTKFGLTVHATAPAM